MKQDILDLENTMQVGLNAERLINSLKSITANTYTTEKTC